MILIIFLSGCKVIKHFLNTITNSNVIFWTVQRDELCSLLIIPAVSTHLRHLLFNLSSIEVILHLFKMFTIIEIGNVKPWKPFFFHFKLKFYFSDWMIKVLTKLSTYFPLFCLSYSTFAKKTKLLHNHYIYIK